MTAFCTMCGKKVPKKRITSGPSEYSGFFCSNACHWSHSDQMTKMMRETELEAEDELKREIEERLNQKPGSLKKDSWAEEALDALDQAAQAATSNGPMTPEEIAARFLGSFAGKFGVKYATHLYGSFAERVRGWAKNRAERKQAEETARKSPPPAEQKKSDQKPTEKPKINPNQPPGFRRTPQQPREPEPPNLEELPLEQQRMWLLRRFYLPPTATMEDVSKHYKAAAKRYHPDNKATGNASVMAVINATKRRLEEIDRELQPVGGGRKKKR